MSNNCHISLEGAKDFHNYAQFFAVWSDKRKTDDECFKDFLSIAKNLEHQISEHPDKIMLVRDANGMRQALSRGVRAAFLAVEFGPVPLVRARIQVLNGRCAPHTSEKECQISIYGVSGVSRIVNVCGQRYVPLPQGWYIVNRDKFLVE